MVTRRIRLLVFANESFPTHRVDVDVLFGEELFSRGHAIDFVMQAATASQGSGPQPWNGRTVFVGATRDGGRLMDRVVRQFAELVHDLRSLARIRHADYDAVQVRDKFVIAAFVAWLARARGLKFFFWLSFPLPESDIHNARAGNAFIPALTMLRGRVTSWLLYRWILPRCDHAFVQSDRMKEQVASHGIDPSRLTAVPMGVDLRSLGDHRSRPARSVGHGLTLGYLGTLDAGRHLDVLIDMLAELHRSGLPARLLLIGDASAPRDREALEAHARQLQVAEHVEITGMLPRQAAMVRMMDADIGLSPIYRSPVLDVGSPTKLVEYLAMGLPVVANDQPEQRSILAACRAGVCVPWGARHFARGVRWIARQRAETIVSMGESGRRWAVANRAYPVIADRVEQCYLQLLHPGTGDAAALRPPRP